MNARPAIATTTQGLIRGDLVAGVRRFLGVPYAAPPVGELRFAAPQPPSNWSGVRDATQPGATAPQVLRPFPQLDPSALVGHGWVKGDDYLTLNVWCPDLEEVDAPAAHGGRPVMVFIHGGGFVLGSKDAPVHDGTAFARDGIVCIAINYRLGLEGFVPIEGAPTNLGLRDQLCALRWVQDNAAAFGGERSNVTVFGESAGAMSIANLVASPLSRGLFRRAIVQSGHGDMVRSLEVARRLTRKLARMLRVSPDVNGFRSRTFEQCVRATDRVQRPFTRLDLRDDSGRDATYGLTRFVPVFGDDVLPRHPVQLISEGAGAEVELLIGSNREEMNLYFVPTKVRRRIPRPLALYFVRRSEPAAWALLRAYGVGQRGRRTGDAFTEALHDAVFRLPARRYVQAFRGRKHLYEFDWRSTACNGELGACHGLELPFVFDTLARATGPKGIAGLSPPQEIANRVHRVWVGFARSGELPWPEYEAGGRAVCRLSHAEWIEDPPMPAAAILPDRIVYT